MKKIERQIFEYIDYCENVRKMSSVTVGFKKFVIGKFVKDTGISDLRKLDNRIFNDWVFREIEGGVSEGSINTYNSVIIAMVRYFLDSKLNIPLNVRLIRSFKEVGSVRRFYTREEIEKVIRSSDMVTGLMIRMMFETGMRIMELTRLKCSDFQGKKVLFVGKGGKQREAYISDETLEILSRYIDKYGVDDYLWGFETLNGEPPTANTIRNWLKEAFFKAGFPDFYPHALRHSFATNLQVKGASVAEIKEMMGHESIATTERYLHGFEGRLEELFAEYQ